MTNLDEQILLLLKENPCLSKAGLQRRLGHNNTKRINPALDRLIEDGAILPQGYWPKDTLMQEFATESAPTAFVSIVASQHADIRMRVQEVLDKHTHLGFWKYISGDAGELSADYGFVLTVPSTDPRLKSFFDDLQALDRVVTRTYWLIG